MNKKNNSLLIISLFINIFLSVGLIYLCTQFDFVPKSKDPVLSFTDAAEPQVISDSDEEVSASDADEPADVTEPSETTTTAETTSSSTTASSAGVGVSSTKKTTRKTTKAASAATNAATAATTAGTTQAPTQPAPQVTEPPVGGDNDAEWGEFF